jgi:hypothetical protein
MGHPAPTGADLLAIFDQVIRRIARRLANEADARRRSPTRPVRAGPDGSRDDLAFAATPHTVRGMRAHKHY